ncbi:MAG: putative DNA binding domain-containing protein [Bacteroidales bacterium]|nr:putative DNA binding domain-containing protein [Bacteroidales bacterium]
MAVTRNFVTLAQKGEGPQIEYKTCREDISDSLYETVCSFLNHNGGQILVGVKDDGSITGVNPDKVETLKTNIINCINNPELFLPCPYFTPRILEVEGKIVMQLDIPCGQYVYRYKGRYWDRNGDADIDVTDQPELLLSLFERKNPHLFEERIAEGMTIEQLEHKTFQYCRNILAAHNSSHPWLQMTDEEILVSTHLAKRDGGRLLLKYAALILFGREDTIIELMPRYRFEAVFHMCTYAQYNDVSQFPNRYDDRRTLHCNLINVYDQLSAFVMRYLPDRFFLPSGSNQREDLRWNLFREIVGNLCVHTDFSSGYACFFHVFKDRVVTKNPTRLMPEIPEGDLTLEQLNNYTKNPLLVRVFHELNWAEDLGSGTRNILRYAPLYYPDYKVEINSGSQFIFSITYQDSPVENVRNSKKMSLTNVPETREMSQAEAENVPELTLEELALPLLPVETKSVKEKKNRRKQAIVSLMAQNPHISSEVIAEKLDVNERTIKRDIKDLREHGIIERVGGDYGGKWLIKKSKQ